jgi:uncharacterized membrane protein (DUF4010 family)
MDLVTLFQHLGIALGLGLLVGLQRERSVSRLAGLRTFPLIAVLGTVCALLAQSLGGWVLAAGLLALTGIILAGDVTLSRQGPPEAVAAAGQVAALPEHPSGLGVTTEVAMLLVFCVGAYVAVGSRELAIAVGAGCAVLLQYKERLHGLAARLGDDDLRAIMQFALLSLVILPALPDRTYGPYDVLNPHGIWLMVVLIVGISLGGYVTYKYFGKGAGTVLGGVLGGMISSTATTVSYARRTAGLPAASAVAVVVIMIASSVVFARLLLELAVVAPASLAVTGPPVVVMLVTLAALSALVWRWDRAGPQEMPFQQNPTELTSAFLFAGVYAAVLLAVAAAREYGGDRGLYVVAMLSGLTDVDAITLSTAQLLTAGRLDAEEGWRIVLVASMSNLVFKAAAVALLGNRWLFAKVGVLYGAALTVGIALLMFWP